MPEPLVDDLFQKFEIIYNALDGLTAKEYGALIGIDDVEDPQVETPDPAILFSKEEIDRILRKVSEANTDDLMELFKCLGINPKTGLTQGDLSGVSLRYADLSNADLKQVDLSGSDLTGANLSGADLSEADLRGTNLSQANLNRTNLMGAIIDDETCFDGTILS